MYGICTVIMSFSLMPPNPRIDDIDPFLTGKNFEFNKTSMFALTEPIVPPFVGTFTTFCKELVRGRLESVAVVVVASAAEATAVVSAVVAVTDGSGLGAPPILAEPVIVEVSVSASGGDGDDDDDSNEDILLLGELF